LLRGRGGSEVVRDIDKLDLESQQNYLDLQQYDMSQINEHKRQLDYLADYEKFARSTDILKLDDAALDQALQNDSVAQK